jgi:acetyl-CoA carboxylase biotin carboxylase subunit
MFRKILIANRGEIACRIIRTARRMGIATVAVYSEADAEALHVREADEAVLIGPPPSADSYLRVDRIVEACRKIGAEAVHPGYGFLSERPAFATALAEAGIVFIGPSPEAIAAMGDKITSKRLAHQAGVTTVPGYLDVIADPETAVAIARDIGYPVMLKASAGGGGKGMRIARDDSELREGWHGAAGEARASFGDDRIFIEKYIAEPRHIEIQVLGDTHGNMVSLLERECSVQRRHQKLVEEAPSIAVDGELREWMGAAAVSAAEAVGYRGAGTCEFLLAPDRSFYFLEMNTRIQVEHPVTELVYGVDLVREQLRIAAGEPMRVHAGWLNPRGWAIECRITSEDPANGFLPSTGRIEYLRIPGGPGVRWDGGVDVGDEVTLYYDSMLAKLIVWGPDRAQAIRRMRRALDELAVLGVATNQGFHRRLLADPAFQAGDIDIQFLDRRPDLARPQLSDGELLQLAVAAALAEDEARRAHRPMVGGDDRGSDAWTQRARHEALR